MKSIAVCIVVKDNYKQMRLCIENLIATSNGANIVLYILNNASKDSMIQYYSKKITECFSPSQFNPIVKKHYFEESEEISIYEAYNKLFKEVTEDFICVFPTSIFVNDNWALDLLKSNNEMFGWAGVLSIKTGIDKTIITSFLNGNTEQMQTICEPENNVIKGIYFIETKIIHTIGGFDRSLFGTGYEQDELCIRYKSNAYHNAYILNQNCIQTQFEDFKADDGFTMYESSIKEMQKTKIFRKQL